MNCDVLGYFKQQSLSATFRATFAKIWATFYFNIWSQWFGPIKKTISSKIDQNLPKNCPVHDFCVKNDQKSSPNSIG